MAASFGLVLDPWQGDVLTDALGERKDGTWAAFEVGLMISRQNGKGSVLEARELAGLLLFGERLIVHSAHEFRTAKEAMRRLEYLLSKSGEKFKSNRSHGEESLELLSGPNRGARVMFQTRTKAGGLGLSGDLVILDEAMIISSEAIQALMPTLSARENPQIWYTGSAVDELIHANCYVFAGVRHRGVNGGSSRLCYLEWSNEPDTDPTDPAARARANPGMGYRIAPEYIEDEYNAFMPDVRAFGTQRLGIGHWPDMSAQIRSEIPVEKWNAMRANTPTLTGSPAVGLHRDPDSGVWVVVGAQYTGQGRTHLEIGYNQAASSREMVRTVIDLVAVWDPVAVAIKGRSDAAALEAELVKAGVEPVMVNGGVWSQMCGGFLNAAVSNGLSHSGQTALDNAAAAAVRRDMPAGGFVWDEDVAGANAAALMAATLAHGALLAHHRPPTKPARPVANTVTADTAELDVMRMAF